MACCKSNSPYLGIILGGVAVIIAGVAISNARMSTTNAQTEPDMQTDSTYVLGHEMPRITGESEHLSKYKGKVLLLVNVASECGLTPQYEALEALYRDKQDAGLVVLAFPANNFGGQEPGTDEEIAQFCSANYAVTFPVFSKISVTGEDAHPLYQQLNAQPDPIGEPPTWNFTKYLVDRSGNAIARFDPQTAPDDPALVAAIDSALASPAK